VVAVHEAVLAHAADRDLDDLVPTLSDVRFFRDDVRDVVADRLAYLFAMTEAVACAAVAALRFRVTKRTEDRAGQLSPSRGCWQRTSALRRRSSRSTGCGAGSTPSHCTSATAPRRACVPW